MNRVQDVNYTGRVLTVTFEEDASESTQLYANSLSAQQFGFRSLVIITPPAWDDADLGLQVSANGTTWVTVGKMTSMPTAATQARVSPADWAKAGSARYVRFASMDTGDESAVAQTAERVFTVIVGN